MPSHVDLSFDLVLDKGTLDAISSEINEQDVRYSRRSKVSDIFVIRVMRNHTALGHAK